MDNFTLTANVVNDCRTGDLGKYSIKDLETASEKLNDMVKFMSLTGEHLTTVGLVMCKSTINNIVFARKHY
jgi:hypothetical protein